MAPTPPRGTACAVVPIFNEQRVLAEVLRTLAPVVDEIICIDDGSSDTSTEIAWAAGATVLRHAVNLGQGAALQTGFDYVLQRTTHQHVVTFDSDGQHRPHDALRMLELARTTSMDVVLGTRDRREKSMPPSRRLLLQCALWFSRRLTGLDLTDTHNGLRVLSRATLTAVRLTLPGMAYASELESGIARSGLSWDEVPISITYTSYSKSKGQPNLNAVNVLYDLMLSRVRGAA